MGELLALPEQRYIILFRLLQTTAPWGTPAARAKPSQRNPSTVDGFREGGAE